MELNEETLRAVKYRVEKNSEILNKLVDQVVIKYSRDLDKQVDALKAKLQGSQKLSIDEVEKLVLMIPAYLYFAVNGLETLGIESDSAKSVRTEAYTEVFLQASGTVADKENFSESKIFKEQLMQDIYARAYKKLRAKTEVATQLCLSTRKVLEKRMQEINIDRMDGNITRK